MGDILDHLMDVGIFGIELHESATVARFEEHCDHYFSHDLNKAELRKLIGELQIIHDKMREVAK